MALGAPSQAVAAPPNASLCAQRQQVKCWDAAAVRRWRDAAEEPLTRVLPCVPGLERCLCLEEQGRPVKCHSTAQTRVPGGNGGQQGCRSRRQSLVSLVTDGFSLLHKSLGLTGGEEPFFLDIILYYLV